MNIFELASLKGLEFIGISGVNSQTRDYSAYVQWVRKGLNGEMLYLAKKIKERESVKKIFPPAKSVIVFAFPYWVNITLNEIKIARYALFEDYHRIIKKKLKDFLKEIGKSGISGKICVDTSPVLERSFAMQAGLGFIGKNTNLINFKNGSYFFLSEIIVDREFEPTPPVEKNYCGKCNLCVKACPTDAIVKPFWVNANLCISYLTIEYKGIIPRNLREKMQGWIFGCDICQEVCPWNKNPIEVQDNFFKLKEELINADFKNFIGLDETRFNEFFRTSPIKRAGYLGFMRNLIVAIGNLRDEIYLPFLIDNVEGGHPLLRIHSIWALSRFEGKRYILKKIYSKNLPYFIKKEITLSLKD